MSLRLVALKISVLAVGTALDIVHIATQTILIHALYADVAVGVGREIQKEARRNIPALVLRNG